MAFQWYHQTGRCTAVGAISIIGFPWESARVASPWRRARLEINGERGSTMFNQVVYGFGWKELGGFTNPKNDEPWLFQSILRGKMMINHQILRVADVVVVHLSHCLRSLAHGEAAITPSVAAAMGRNCWDAERGRRGGGSNSSRLSRRLLFWVLRMCGLSSVAPALWQDWV